MSDTHQMSVYITLGNGHAVGVSADEQWAIYNMDKSLIVARLGEATIRNLDNLRDALNRLAIHATDVL